jgi:hypothetical protein
VRRLVRKLTQRVRPAARRQTADADPHLDAPLLVHVHIPKCAGSTFKRILSLTFGERHLDWYSEDPFFLLEPDEIAARLEANPELMSLASHSIRSFPPRLGTRVPLYVTFLRNPLDQFVSYITFLKKNKLFLTETHQLYVPPDCHEMTVRDIARWLVDNERDVPFKSDYTVHFLSEMVFRDRTAGLRELLDGAEGFRAAMREVYERCAVDIALAVLERFFFVGIVEEMERSIVLLSERLAPYGLRLKDSTFQRENVSNHLRGDTSWLNESDDVGRRVLKSIEKDFLLYKRCRERLAPEPLSTGGSVA